MGDSSGGPCSASVFLQVTGHPTLGVEGASLSGIDARHVHLCGSLSCPALPESLCRPVHSRRWYVFPWPVPGSAHSSGQWAPAAASGPCISLTASALASLLICVGSGEIPGPVLCPGLDSVTLRSCQSSLYTQNSVPHQEMVCECFLPFHGFRLHFLSGGSQAASFLFWQHPPYLLDLPVLLASCPRVLW